MKDDEVVLTYTQVRRLFWLIWYILILLVFGLIMVFYQVHRIQQRQFDLMPRPGIGVPQEQQQYQDQDNEPYPLPPPLIGTPSPTIVPGWSAQAPDPDTNVLSSKGIYSLETLWAYFFDVNFSVELDVQQVLVNCQKQHQEYVQN
jgi:hypothetical protein